MKGWVGSLTYVFILLFFGEGKGFLNIRIPNFEPIQVRRTSTGLLLFREWKIELQAMPAMPRQKNEEIIYSHSLDRVRGKK